MADAATVFFTDLGSRGFEPVLHGVTASFRFDLLEGTKAEHWLVVVSKGNVKVSKSNAKADCVLRTTRALFNRVASGEQNAMAAEMRGEMALEGNWTLLVQFQRLFPGPPSTNAETGKPGRARRRS